MKTASVPHIELKYKNHRGKIAIREIEPKEIYYDPHGNQFHPEPGWRLRCFDIEKQAPRTYALADCDFRMRGTLQDAWEGVREFHLTFDHPAADDPTAQPKDRAFNRANWIESEIEELLDASGVNYDSFLRNGEFKPFDSGQNLTQQADAYLDIIYFALGGLVELGVEPSKIFDLVQRANMAKVWPDGTVHKRDDGKVIKPPGWTAPDDAIEAEILSQSWQARRESTAIKTKDLPK